jgi:prepilin-type N-terminal cleavage/methylation domain-containing protein
MSNQNSKSFTLIELLIVLAIIAILAIVLIAIINPGAIFSRARDTKRINDLKNIEKIMDVIYFTDYNFNELNYASTNVVYISLQDNSSTCGSYLSDLPSLPSGWSYRCSATPTNIDGTGWISIPFRNFPVLNLSQLPVDPINKPPYFYSFVVGGSYEVTAALESDSNKGPDAIGGKDGGDHNFVYEAGTNKKLTPSSVQARAEPDSLKQGLVGWWTFDEGTGTTTKDLSGNGNDGTLVNNPKWVDGKVAKALEFSPGYVSVNYSSSLDSPAQTNSISIVLWVWVPIDTSDYPPRCMIYREGTNGNYLERDAPYCFAIDEGGPGNTNSYVITIHDRLWSGLNLYGRYKSNFEGTWHFAAITYSNGVFKLYLDELEKTTDLTWDILSSPNKLYIAKHSGVFVGLIDEVRIYNRALSDAEIKALYDATK